MCVYFTNSFFFCDLTNSNLSAKMAWDFVSCTNGISHATIAVNWIRRTKLTLIVILARSLLLWCASSRSPQLHSQYSYNTVKRRTYEAMAMAICARQSREMRPTPGIAKQKKTIALFEIEAPQTRRICLNWSSGKLNCTLRRICCLCNICLQ